MTFGVHPLNHLDPLVDFVDLTLAIIVGSNEERCFGITGSQNVKQLFSIAARAIVKGHSDGTGLRAFPDEFLEGDLANAVSVIVLSWSAGRESIGITTTEAP